MKTFQEYEKSSKMIAQIENYIPQVEAEQLQSLKEIGLNIEIPTTDGKRDCYINGIATSLKRTDIGAPSLISNQIKATNYLKKYSVIYDTLKNSNGKMLVDIYSIDEIRDFIHYLAFSGTINGIQPNPAQQIVLSGRYTNNFGTFIYGHCIKIDDIASLDKLMQCLKIEYLNKKGLGLRINISNYKLIFNINKKRIFKSEIVGL